MAGLYFHIPFCKRACHYCDFHFSTSLALKGDLLNALARELELRQDYLGGQRIDTIYFGGGTPSLLHASEIDRLIGSVAKFYEISPQAEITLEANPDDLHAEQVNSLRSTPVNRFSIGIQSFFDEDLLWMNRAHTASEADAAIKRVQDAGFENLTADLIYGYPLLTDDKWRENINRLASMRIPHVSAYGMTIEPQTALASFIRKSKQPAMDEQQSASQFIQLVERLNEAGYEHYEISNFAKPGSQSRHNTNYWNRVPYLGIGPSAHSFDGVSRQWNVANNNNYLAAIGQGTVPAEHETLSRTDRFNECLMTGLRMRRGIIREYLAKEFGSDYLAVVDRDVMPFIDRQWVELHEGAYRLTQQGKLFADRIASELMIVD